MNCKICNKHLYEKLDIRNILSTKQTHLQCEEILLIDSQVEVLPITNNVIHFDYLFDKKKDLNYEYLTHFLLIKQLLKYRSHETWSVVFIYEEAEYERLEAEAKYLLLHFGQKPIVFISMFAY